MATEINAGRVAMVPKGEWSASTAYVRLDVVSYHGSSYVCKQDCTGQNPSTATGYWQLLSSGLDPTVDTISAKHYEGSTVTAETSISAAGVISKTASGVTRTFNLPAESGTLATASQVEAIPTHDSYVAIVDYGIVNPNPPVYLKNGEVITALAFRTALGSILDSADNIDSTFIVYDIMGKAFRFSSPPRTGESGVPYYFENYENGYMCLLKMKWVNNAAVWEYSTSSVISVQSDWDEDDATSLSYIQNKPDLDSALAAKADASDLAATNAAVANLQEIYDGLTQSGIEVVTSLPPTGTANKIYRLVGTTSYSDYMYNSSDLTTPILMATYSNAIDNEPTAGSDNLVKSGGVADVYGEYIDNDEYVKVVTDSNDKIIAGVRTDGSVFIEEFDDDTKDKIIGFVGGQDPVSSVINIPLLDENFTSPVPYKVYDGDTEDATIKGQGGAKYVFDLPLGEESFNIRVKFRITENLLNQEKTAKILQLANTYIDAAAVPLSQYSNTETYNGESVTMLWNDFAGGIKYNNGQGDTAVNKLAIGQYAFYIQYTGAENTASIENDGTKFILKIGSTTHEFAYSTYDTVASLYEAIKAVTDIVIAYKEIEGRMSEELAIFPECQIKTTCYTPTDRFHSTIEEYVDAYQFYVPYAVDDSWHQIEVVKLGNYVFYSCDGILKTAQYNSSADYSHLILGDGNSMYFKDLSIDLTSPNDAEYWENGDRLVSSVNPAIIITEGHGMFDGPVAESASASVNLQTSTDRLYRVYAKMRSMGYVPVSIKDIADYYAGNKQLPKRCFTSVFDGERWGDWLDAKFRKVFAEFGVCPAIAAVTGATGDVTYNVYNDTNTITVKEAAELCLKNNFSIISHTRDHWKTDCVKPSTLLDELTQDIYSADNCLADAMILVFPGGAKTRAVFAAMKWLGYRLGISIATAATNYNSNMRFRNKYSLHRVEIGFRTTLETIFNKLV